jgi:hypothetical protein
MQRFLTAFFLFGIVMFLQTTGLKLSAAHAQPAPAVHGDYTGSLGPLRVQLHIHVANDGALSATLDSPNQGATGIPCTEVSIEGGTLTFKALCRQARHLAR